MEGDSTLSNTGNADNIRSDGLLEIALRFFGGRIGLPYNDV